MDSVRVALIVLGFVNVTVTMIALCSEFRSFQRVFGWVFVPYIVFFLFRVAALYTTPKFTPFRIGGPVHHDMRRTAILVGVIFSVWVFGYVFLVLFPVACDSNVMPYCWFHTPVSKSSCYGTPGVSGVVYSAVGALSGAQTPNTANMICVIEDARYADGNGEPILTYPPRVNSTLPNYDATPCPTSSPCLCSSRKQDYLNPALGVSEGCFVGSNQSATIRLCPGNVINDAQVVGVAVCGTCLSTYESEGYSNAAFSHCDATPVQSGSYWCNSIACPRLGEVLKKQNTLVTFAVVLALGLEGFTSWALDEMILVHLM